MEERRKYRVIHTNYIHASYRKEINHYILILFGSEVYISPWRVEIHIHVTITESRTKCSALDTRYFDSSTNENRDRVETCRFFRKAIRCLALFIRFL